MNNNFQWFTHTPFLSNEQCDDIINKLQEETNWVSGYEGAHIVNANEKSFDRHADYDIGIVSTNKLTCLIQLSAESEFEGGDLHFAFVNDGEFFKTPYKKGYALIFPSIISHMVTELTAGERYIMREIISGEPFR